MYSNHLFLEVPEETDNIIVVIKEEEEEHE